MDRNSILGYMVDETDETMLSFYLDNAKSVILNKLYPYDHDDNFAPELPERYYGLQVRLAAYMINKRGAEGETQHNENQIYRYYGSADIPNEYLNEIVPFVGTL